MNLSLITPNITIVKKIKAILLFLVSLFCDCVNAWKCFHIPGQSMLQIISVLITAAPKMNRCSHFIQFNTVMLNLSDVKITLNLTFYSVPQIGNTKKNIENNTWITYAGYSVYENMRTFLICIQNILLILIELYGIEIFIYYNFIQMLCCRIVVCTAMMWIPSFCHKIS